MSADIETRYAIYKIGQTKLDKFLADLKYGKNVDMGNVVFDTNDPKEIIDYIYKYQAKDDTHTIEIYQAIVNTEEDATHDDRFLFGSDFDTPSNFISRFSK